MGKGEIACYKQFLRFKQCFRKAYTADTQKPGLVWERVKFVKPFSKYSFISYLLDCFSTLSQTTSFGLAENTEGKGEISHYSVCITDCYNNFPKIGLPVIPTQLFLYPHFHDGITCT